MNIAVIGGGAAGFFGAIKAAEKADVTLFEKSGKLLSKVLVSGGGRCNVTHDYNDINELLRHYPRGNKELRNVLMQFMPTDTVEWFRQRGVALKTEKDGRMFPVTDQSSTIANALLKAAEQSGVDVRTNAAVTSIEKSGNKFFLNVNGRQEEFDRVLIASGGGTKLQHFDWLAQLGHTIVSPVPSLFTFNIPDKQLHELAGISVQEAEMKIADTPLVQIGPLLITHWGMSGPAILKLSAWGARILNERDYQFKIRVNWVGEIKEEQLREQLNQWKNLNARKQTGNSAAVPLPSRLWVYLLERSEINPAANWADIGKKPLNKLVENLLRGEFNVDGKSTFKEEFVTAGGISLRDVDMKTMQSLKCPGLYFAGEVLDIDGITGGFNFQSAWATGYVAGKNMIQSQD
jgi:hypothetical protein